MDGFWSSASKWFNEKTSSPLYFTYIGFFVVWNWKFFQIIFLESDSLFSSPRVEYVYSNLWLNFPLNFRVPIWLNIPIDFIINFAWHTIPPAFFTYLAIVYLPKLHKWALDKYLESVFERKRMFATKKFEDDKWLLDQEKIHSQTLENIASVKEEKLKTEERIKKTMTDEEKWELEYQKFEKNPSFYKFKQIIETIYKYDGIIDEGYGVAHHADTGALATADTRELITHSGSNRNTIELTKKGKFFAKMYLEKYPL